MFGIQVSLSYSVMEESPGTTGRAVPEYLERWISLELIPMLLADTFIVDTTCITEASWSVVLPASRNGRHTRSSPTAVKGRSTCV